ncbi:MAG: hypothetical protein HY059_11270 [Proteobacteria bacterium]|nr:hypothetical protein [Pseudomonadota bacterium]
MAASSRTGMWKSSYASPIIATALFAAAVLGGIWTVTYWSLAGDREELYRTAHAELLGGQNILAAQVGRTVESAESLIEAVEHWVIDQEGAPDPAEFDSLIERLQRRHMFPLSVRLFDLAGDLVNPGGYTTGRINVADREYVQVLAERPEGTILIGRQILARDVGVRQIPIAMRARPNILNVAYVVTAIPVEQLTNIFDGLFVTAPGIVGIVREDGRVLFRSPDPEGFTDRNVDLESLVPGGIRNPRRQFGLFEHRIDPNGQPIATAFKRVDRQPLYVYGSFRINDLEAKLASRAPWTFFVAITTSLGVILLAGTIAVFVSLREREAERVRAALDEAEAANTAKREFLANVSHELRTPLNAIIGFSEFVVMQTFGPIHERYRGYVGDVLSAGRHLLGVVDQLLDLAAIEARRFVVRPEAIDPGDVVHDVAEMMRPLATKRQVRITVQPPAERFVAMTDSGALRQILVNLVGNAVKFCRTDGIVAIDWVARAEGGVEITIADTGEGIAADDIKNIFEPFWRKESSYVRRHGGTGLGLSLTRQLVERLDGRIEVESELGKGSRFRISLPDKAGSAAAKLAA